MKKLLSFLFLAAFIPLAIPVAETQEKKEEVKLHRGARRTPFLKIIESIKAGKAKIYAAKAPPPQVVVVPKRLSMWGNSQYGDCVSAESAFAIADYSTFLGMEEIFVTEATIISWARSHGWLNGADLLSVIQDMQKDGVADEKGTIRKAGTPSSVDYRTEATLQSAIAQGPVSIAIDANALPSGAGNASGWYAFGGRSYPNTDHCVSLCGFAKAVDAFKALGVPLPSGVDPNKIVYFLFTWNTIGLVDHPWILGTVVEAWVRNPTVTNLTPPPPPPVVKVTVAVPNVIGSAGTPVKFNPVASGGTSPYLFLFDYGDGIQDGSGTHTYKAADTFRVTVTAVDSAGQVGTGTCTATIGVTPGPGPTPTPGGFTIVLPQDTPAGTYQLVNPAALDAIQKKLDAIRGNGRKKTSSNYPPGWTGPLDIPGYVRIPELTLEQRRILPLSKP